RNEFAKAVSQLEQALQNAPLSLEISNDLGVAYMESGSAEGLAKALDQFQRALTLNPRYEPALFNMVLAYERLGRFAEAEQPSKRYLEIDAESAWAKEVQAKLQFWKHQP